MHQPFHPGLELGERPKLGQFRDLGRHRIADVVLGFDARPGIFLDLLETERDLLVLAIDAHHAHVDLLADTQHLRRMLDLSPGQLRQVNQPVSSAEVHKGAKVCQRGDAPVANLACLKLRQQAVLLLRSPLLGRRALG